MEHRDLQPSLDELVAELAHVREAGLEPLEVEPLIPELPVLVSLGVVRNHTRTDTDLARATSICRLVREAAERLSDDPDHPGPPRQPSHVAQAQMLLRAHYATKKLTAAMPGPRPKRPAVSATANTVPGMRPGCSGW
jgi:hypothetical protein